MMKKIKIKIKLKELMQPRMQISGFGPNIVLIPSLNKSLCLCGSVQFHANLIFLSFSMI